MNKKLIIELSVTVLAALLAAVAFVGFTTFSMENKVKSKYMKVPKVQEKLDERQIIIGLISKYEKLALKNPTEYKYNSKLGNLYDLISVDKDAEKNYKQAVALSPYGVYSTYFDLANFYLRANRLEEAKNIINSIKNKRNKAVISAKGDFYINLGDVYFDYADDRLALDSYETALEYYKEAKRKPKTEIAVSRIMDAYDSLARGHLADKKLNSAIENLENSLKYKNDSVINYKLAILYMDIDPVKSYQFIRKTYDMDPGIINYNIYEKIVINNINYYNSINKPDEAELFKFKLKVVNKFKDRYLISPEDFKVDIVSFNIKPSYFSDKKTATVKFKIQNYSKDPTKSLFIKVNSVNNGKEEVVFQKRFFSKKEPLKVMESSPLITFKYSFNDPIDSSYTNKISFDFYVAKKENIRKIKIYTLEIPK